MVPLKWLLNINIIASGLTLLQNNYFSNHAPVTSKQTVFHQSKFVHDTMFVGISEPALDKHHAS